MLLRNTTLPDGRTGVDVLVADGRIAAVGPALPAPEGVEPIDALGWLLAPPFVDAHFHMDSTLTYGTPRVNRSGTLLEGIALWGELKPLLTQDAIVERALQELHDALPAARLAGGKKTSVVRERRATFSLAPGQPARPAAVTPLAGFYLAGDWTDTGLPGTIESAALSGHRAAAAGCAPARPFPRRPHRKRCDAWPGRPAPGSGCRPACASPLPPRGWTG